MKLFTVEELDSFIDGKVCYRCNEKFISHAKNL